MKLQTPDAGRRLQLSCLNVAAREGRIDERGDPRPSRRASRLHADAPPQVTQEGKMIEFLAQMPTDTMTFLTMAVLGLAAMLIGTRLI